MAMINTVTKSALIAALLGPLGSSAEGGVPLCAAAGDTEISANDNTTAQAIAQCNTRRICFRWNQIIDPPNIQLWLKLRALVTATWLRSDRNDLLPGAHFGH
jgi:hypothetical protein